MVEVDICAEIGLQDQAKRFLSREAEEGNYRRVGDGDTVPVFCGGDESFGAVIFWRDGASCCDELFADERVRKTVGVGLYFEHVGRAEIVLVVQQIIDARGAIGLFPIISQIRFVFREEPYRTARIY